MVEDVYKRQGDCGLDGAEEHGVPRLVRAGGRQRRVHDAEQGAERGGVAVDLYELCDELYISYSLLKNDIQKMNVSFAFLHIRFYSRDDCLYLQGSEKDKRKLMNHIIQQTQGKDFVDTNVLKTYFHEKDISQLLSILNEVHADHAYYLNDFARSNLLIHLLIMVSRLRCGDPLPAAGQAGGAAEIPPDDSDYLVATDICRRIDRKSVV